MEVLFIPLGMAVLAMIGVSWRWLHLRRLVAPAAALSGQPVRIGSWLRPTVYLHHLGLPLQLQACWGQTCSPRGDVVRFAAPCPYQHLRCKVRVANVLDRLLRVLRQSSIRLGTFGFDQQFHVIGSDPTRIRQMLDGCAQAALLILVRYKVRLEIRHGQLEIFAAMPQETGFGSLTEVIDASVTILDSLLGTGDQGVQFVEAKEECDLPAEACCPVCAERLHGQLVFCRRCDTPHHKECWRYAGGCARFACGHVRKRKRAGMVES